MLRVNLLPRDRRGGSGRGLSLSLSSLRPGRLGDLVDDPWSLAVGGAAVLALLAVGGSWFLQRQRAQELDQRISALAADSARLGERRILLDSLEAERDGVKERFRLVTRVDRHRYAWPRLLHALSDALPQAAWLSEIERETPLPALTVLVRGAAASPLAVTAYVRSLEAAPVVEYVDLVRTQRSSEAPGGGQSFTLRVHYAGSEPERGAEEGTPWR